MEYFERDFIPPAISSPIKRRFHNAIDFKSDKWDIFTKYVLHNEITCGF